MFLYLPDFDQAPTQRGGAMFHNGTWQSLSWEFDEDLIDTPREKDNVDDLAICSACEISGLVLT